METQTNPDVEKTSESDPNKANLLTKIAQLEGQLKEKDDALAILKARNSELEKEQVESQKFKVQHSKEAEEIAVLKEKSENTLTRAKELIFEKTKIVKNQELQIEALNLQIESLKEVVTITKDLLEIRNLECKQLETKIHCIEERVAAEKERYELMHKKLEAMIRHNGELKREYETQLCLFSALRERYNEKELAKGVLDDARDAVNEASRGSTANEASNGSTVNEASNGGAVNEASNGSAVNEASRSSAVDETSSSSAVNGESEEKK